MVDYKTYIDIILEELITQYVKFLRSPRIIIKYMLSKYAVHFIVHRKER